ncbi:hypothetical protein FB451DRAFT_622659 [Mycena latifolia]|nr:hypothetical protein FB451DRAFT_622659 [Mycena latifolia]
MITTPSCFLQADMDYNFYNISRAQLIVSTLLGLSALIPSDPLRYTSLVITIFLALVYAIYSISNIPRQSCASSRK